jgi:hypothetical protein
VIFEPGKKIISRHILYQHWYTCPISLPLRRNPQHKSLLTVISANSAPPFHHLRLSNVFERISRLSYEPLYKTNTSHRKHFFMIILCIESFCSKKHKRRLLFGITLLKHGRHFYYWNQPLNMRMRFCYTDCHEAGLCCYLVIHIENLLRSLLLFYFHLWPIYWLSLVIHDA